MSLGELRRFLSSIENLPDEASVKARVTFKKYLRSITVDDDDVGFHDYIRKVGLSDETDVKVEAKARAK